MLAINNRRTKMTVVSNQLPPMSPYLRSLHCSIHNWHRRHWEIVSQQQLDVYTARLRDQFQQGNTAVGATVKIIFWPMASNGPARDWMNSHRLPHATNTPELSFRAQPAPQTAGTQGGINSDSDSGMTGT
jgi:hypothetical protein